MKKFRQKIFAATSSPMKFGTGDIVMNAGFTVLGHKQNKDAQIAGQEQLKQNEVAFKDQLKQQEEEHQAKMQELSQQAKQITFSRVTSSKSKLKQKVFFWQMAAMMAPGVVQGRKANKIAEEQGEEQMMQNAKFQKQQMEQQEKFQKEQMKMQEKIAKMQANATRKAPAIINQPTPMPEPGSQGLFSEIDQKVFTDPTRLSKIGQTVYEIGKTARQLGASQKIASGLAMGTTMAGLSYGVDKVISKDAKKNGLLQEQTSGGEEKKKRNLGKSLLVTGATIGTGILAARGAKSGKLGKGLQDTYNRISNKSAKDWKAAAGKFGKQYKTGFKEQFVDKDGKINKLGTALTIGFPATAAIGYATQKKSMKDQINQEGQRVYSNPGVFARLGKSISRNYGKFKTVAKDPNQGFFKAVGKAGNKVTTKTLNGISSFMMGGGEKGVNNFKNTLSKNISTPADSKVKESYSQDIANFIGKHKKTALAGSIAVGSLMFKPFEYGEKGTKKALGAVDKNAFAYEKSQNQQVQQ